MTRSRIQTLSAVTLVVIGAGVVWAFSGLEGAGEVHPRFPIAMQLYGVYLVLLAPLALMPTPLPSLGRLGICNALGLGAGGLVIGMERSGALLALPLICLGIALALWPPVPHPERDRRQVLILTLGGFIAALLPAAWSIWT